MRLPRALVLLPALLCAPAATWAAAPKAAAAAGCARANDLCRQKYLCPVGGDLAARDALDPWYCQACESELARCMTSAGERVAQRRGALRKKGLDLGVKPPREDVKAPRIGADLKEPKPKRPSLLDDDADDRASGATSRTNRGLPAKARSAAE